MWLDCIGDCIGAVSGLFFRSLYYEVFYAYAQLPGVN